MTDWRKIERALVDWFASEGFDTIEAGGQWYAEDGYASSFNLTALARHLANELAPPP